MTECIHIPGFKIFSSRRDCINVEKIGLAAMMTLGWCVMNAISEKYWWWFTVIIEKGISSTYKKPCICIEKSYEKFGWAAHENKKNKIHRRAYRVELVGSGQH